MSALDQAFIRAYRHEDASSCVLPPVEAQDQRQMTYNTVETCFDTIGVCIAPCDVRAESYCPAKPDVTHQPPPTETKQATVALPVDVTDPPEPRSGPEPVRESRRPDSEHFRPLLQVDGFVWPKVCRKLSVEAHLALDRLADGLVAGSADDCKVVAFASCLRGEGGTTLMLSVAQRLSERNVNLVMVDADLVDPSLGRRLGLLPDVGWQEVLAGKTSLAEAVVESIEDHVALLPLCGQPVGQNAVANGIGAFGPMIAKMRRNFPLVLVDLGPLDEKIDTELTALAEWTDALLLVSSVRATLPEQVVEARDRLHKAGVAKVGIVENFISRVKSK